MIVRSVVWAGAGFVAAHVLSAWHPVAAAVASPFVGVTRAVPFTVGLAAGFG